MNPAFGGATMGTILRREGHRVSDPTVRKYMREMGLQTIYPGPNLSNAVFDRKYPVFRIQNVDLLVFY
ncbi:MAG: hypothetical protein FWG40_10935 [Peptococcaceae bacterium]|nr:hypothetical protein [Peptococcaceae bacterium]